MPIGIHAADIQDLTAFPPNHLPGECLGGKQRADEVQIEHELHASLVEIEEGFGISLDIAHFKIFLVRGGTGIVATCTVEQDNTRQFLLNGKNI